MLPPAPGRFSTTTVAAVARRRMRDRTAMSLLPEPFCSGHGRFRLLHHAQVFANRGTRQPEVIAQRRAGIRFAVEAAPLQLRNDEVDEFVELTREPGRHHTETV